MINAYDFDKTIYDGDSTIDFYLFCLKKKKIIIFWLPIQFFGFIVYKLKIKPKEYFKEKFFIFLKSIDDIDLYIKQFWNKNSYKIKDWYLKQHKKTDVIISASPYFLLEPVKKIIKIDYLIATIVDKKTGKFLSKNCYGIEKVNRLNSEYKVSIKNFYSDSLSDKPLMNLACNAYIVKKNIVKKIK